MEAKNSNKNNMYKQFINSTLLNVSMIKFIKYTGFCSKIWDISNLNGDVNDDLKSYLKINKISINKDENTVVMYLRPADYIYVDDNNFLSKQNDIPTWLFVIIIKYLLTYLEETFEDENYTFLKTAFVDNNCTTLNVETLIEQNSCKDLFEKYVSIIEIYLKHTDVYVNFGIKTSTLDLIVKDILNYNTPSQVIYEPSTIPSQQRFPIEHVHDNINMRMFQDRFQNKIGFDKNIGIQESGCIFSFKNEKIYLQFDDYNTVVYSDIIIKELNEIQLFMFTKNPTDHKFIISNTDLINTYLSRWNMELIVEEEILIVLMKNLKNADLDFNNNDLNIIFFFNIYEDNLSNETTPSIANNNSVENNINSISEFDDDLQDENIFFTMDNDNSYEEDF